MNTTPSPSHAPEPGNLSGEATATAYLAQEVPKARRTLKRTRIIGIVLILLVGAYIGTISIMMVKYFQPQEAAQIAGNMLSQHAASEGPVLAAKIEQEIPALIRQAPDYLISATPGFRKELQQQLETEFQAYCHSLGKNLGNQLDKLIDDHKAEIKTLLENANDRTAIRKILPDFNRVIAEFIHNDVDGMTLKKRIDEVAATLKEVEKRMDHLANGSDLTPEEQKARHALARLSKVIQDNTQMPESTASLKNPQVIRVKSRS